MDDPLYGMHPDPKAKGDYGYNLGAMDARGERGALIVDQDFLTRLPSNFPLDTPTTCRILCYIFETPSGPRGG
jgi:hypothetical protein